MHLPNMPLPKSGILFRAKLRCNTATTAISDCKHCNAHCNQRRTRLRSLRPCSRLCVSKQDAPDTGNGPRLSRSQPPTRQFCRAPAARHSQAHVLHGSLRIDRAHFRKHHRRSTACLAEKCRRYLRSLLLHFRPRIMQSA